MVVRENILNTTTIKLRAILKYYCSNVYLESHLKLAPVRLYQKLQALLYIKLLLVEPTHQTVDQG